MSLRRFEHLARVSEAGLGNGSAAGHSGEFLNPGISVQRPD
jgi:hypothetical protein